MCHSPIFVEHLNAGVPLAFSGYRGEDHLTLGLTQFALGRCSLPVIENLARNAIHVNTKNALAKKIVC